MEGVSLQNVLQKQSHISKNIELNKLHVSMVIMVIKYDDYHFWNFHINITLYGFMSFKMIHHSFQMSSFPEIAESYFLCFCYLQPPYV